MNPLDDCPAKFSDDVAGQVSPWYSYGWYRTLMLVSGCALGAAAATAIALFSDWHQTRCAELASQRESLRRFLQSPEFDRFLQTSDRQLVALNNFVAACPREARAVFPAVGAREEAAREIPWAVQVLPLPVPACDEPARIAAALREISALLARRRQVADAEARVAARALLLRMVTPFALAFFKRENGAGFPALAFEPAMQDDVMAAFAAHFQADVRVAEAERFFALYRDLGPAMWRAIESEQQRSAASVQLFALQYR